MVSRSFGSETANKHWVKADHPIQDARNDVEVAFSALEEETSALVTANARIRLNTQPVNGNTVVIGADTYEFNTALPASDPSFIPVVLSGTSLAADQALLIAAINDSTLGTELVFAELVNTDFLQIKPAEGQKGGFPAGRVRKNFFPSIALSATLAGTPAWSSNNLGRTAATTMKRTLLSVTVDAVNVAAAFDVEVPFTPLRATLAAHVTSSGDLDGSTTTATYVPVPARNVVTIDMTAGATPPVATDVLHIFVEGF